MSAASPSRSQEIYNVLRDEVLRGQYRPGERLPSERDLASRFATSRGTVREAFKKLEQLGVVTIQPGGARVVPIQDCTLGALGPLLDLGDVPDPQLIDQALEILSVLVDFGVAKAMANGADSTVEEARAITREMLAAEVDQIQEVRGPPRLSWLFVEAADHLVLLLIMNTLRSEVVERLQAVGFPPRHDPQALRRIAVKLDRALGARDASQVADTMGELFDLLRKSVQQKFDDIEGERAEAIT